MITDKKGSKQVTYVGKSLKRQNQILGKDQNLNLSKNSISITPTISKPITPRIDETSRSGQEIDFDDLTQIPVSVQIAGSCQLQLVQLNDTSQQHKLQSQKLEPKSFYFDQVFDGEST